MGSRVVEDSEVSILSTLFGLLEGFLIPFNILLYLFLFNIIFSFRYKRKGLHSPSFFKHMHAMPS